MDALVEEEVGLQSRFPKIYTLSKILAWEAHANIVPFVNSNKIYKDQGFLQAPANLSCVRAEVT